MQTLAPSRLINQLTLPDITNLPRCTTNLHSEQRPLRRECRTYHRSLPWSAPLIAIAFFFLSHSVDLRHADAASVTNTVALASDYNSSSGITVIGPDIRALLAIKASIYADPLGKLSTWRTVKRPNPSDNAAPYFCYWTGVSCDWEIGNGNYRVSGLYLSGWNLSGTISPSIAGLEYLRTLDLSNNFLSGIIPLELGNLVHLQQLNFSRNNLQGSIPSKLSNLSSLLSLDLSNNNISGTFPPELMSLCGNLQFFILSGNAIAGAVPTSIRACTQLTVLHLSDNQLTGAIPSTVGFLTKLQVLVLSKNSFTGNLPLSLQSLAILKVLDLSYNDLSGSIPWEYGKLWSLQVLDLSMNSLSGVIPPSLSGLTDLTTLYLQQNFFDGSPWFAFTNLVNLQRVDLSFNNLTGDIPPEIGQLRRLRKLSLSGNGFTGSISPIANCTSLTELLLDSNSFDGTIPPELMSRLPWLRKLRLQNNFLHGSLPDSIGNLSNIRILTIDDNLLSGSLPSGIGNLVMLQQLSLSGNPITGVIPDSIGNLTALSRLDLSFCNFSGSIPYSITNLVSLTYLSVEGNNLTGEFPTEMARLTSLRTLSVGSNQLTGPIFAGLANLSYLEELYLYRNSFSGFIPEEIGQLGRLQELWAGHNQLEGTIPWSIGNLQSLEFLSLTTNKLTGPIPASLGNCTSLAYLDLSWNALSGKIPAELGSLSAKLAVLDLSHNGLSGTFPLVLTGFSNLETLSMASNHLSGNIPSGLGNCQNLVVLDLSDNQFNGSIPPDLANLRKLQIVSFENNNLSGAIPTLASANITAFGGNPNLCGDIIGVPCVNVSDGSAPTTTERQHRSSSTTTIAIVSAVCSAAAVSVATGLIWWCVFVLRAHKRIKLAAEKLPIPNMVSADQDQKAELLIFDKQLKLSLTDLWLSTEGFRSSNAVGSGKLFTVYRGELRQDGRVIAVKKLSLPSSLRERCRASFVNELQSLGQLRHTNLVHMLCFCFSADTMAVVQDFMSNGSLDDHMHIVDSVSPGRPGMLRGSASLPELRHSSAGDLEDMAEEEQRPIVGRGRSSKCSTSSRRHGGSYCELNWETRFHIIRGVAEALAFLHNQPDKPVVHGNVKPSNVLFDDNFEPRVADFAIAEVLRSHIKSVAEDAATALNSCHAAPGNPNPQLTTQGDVYSFGVLVLQMLTLKPSSTATSTDRYLPRLVRSHFPEQMTKLLDDSLQQESVPSRREEMVQVMALALHCTQDQPEDRPTMEEVRMSLLRIQSHDKTSTRFYAPLEDVILHIDNSSSSYSYSCGTMSNQGPGAFANFMRHPSSNNFKEEEGPLLLSIQRIHRIPEESTASISHQLKKTNTLAQHCKS